jgi:Ham1 family protein
MIAFIVAQIVSQKLDLDEYQGSVDYIAIKKCQSALKLISGPILIEDTSLHLNALNGLPGPYIKDFIQKLELNGLPKMISAWQDKSAVAKCIVAYGENESSEIMLFHGSIKGSIVNSAGSSGFGWDIYFVPEGYNQTFAELGDEVKNKISHRFKAFQAFKEYFLQKKIN